MAVDDPMPDPGLFCSPGDQTADGVQMGVQDVHPADLPDPFQKQRCVPADADVAHRRDVVHRDAQRPDLPVVDARGDRAAVMDQQDIADLPLPFPQQLHDERLRAAGIHDAGGNQYRNQCDTLPYFVVSASFCASLRRR